MNGVIVHSWEWVEWDITDRYGRPKMVRKLMPREYTEIPYVQPQSVKVDEDEEWVEFGGPPILW